MPFDVASEKSPEVLSSAASNNVSESTIVKPSVLPAEVSTRPPPDSLTTLPEILSSLSLLESEEAELSATLQELLANRDPVVSSLSRLHNLLPQLDELRADAYLLTRKVSVTAETADRIGGSVRALDEEMRRVRESSDRVAQVMDLKSSLAALRSAIESQDWESAARHCSRAMAVPQGVIDGEFARATVPTAENHIPPAEALQVARQELLTTFKRSFEQASSARDSAATSRFFKLFPAIGWEAEGLEAYATFVVDLVRVRAPTSAKTSSPLYYITALTALFESIALIVDQHQPIVDKYYGTGKMYSVVTRLVQECDRVVKSTLDSFEEERNMQRKLSDTAAPTLQALSTPHSSGLRPQTVIDEDIVDVKQIDKVLSELAAMSGRWNLFRKFLFDRLSDDESDSETGDDTAHPLNGTDPTEYEGERSAPKIPEGFQIIESSQSRQLFQTLLETYYIPLEIWYTRSIIDKAHRLSSADLSQPQMITTTPDDTFYFLKVVLTRMLSTGSTMAVEKTSEFLQSIMDKDYAGVIKKKLDDVYRTGGVSGTGGVRGEKVERELRQSFIILLNDLDVSSIHMERLIRDFLGSQTIPQNFLEFEAPTVHERLSSFTSLVPKFRSTLRAGIEQLFNQLMRPKLRTLIVDVYRDVTYALDDEGYTAAEYQDLVRKRFVKAWEGLIDGYKDTFTDSNYRLFFGLALDVILKPWEKAILSLKYTELGAIRFDRDLRSITTYLSSQTAFGDAREKFTRLQQISTLLNLDNEEEVDQFYDSSGIAWKLTSKEAQAVAGLRI
ncbi:COG4-domain-containing protein [Thelephora terrestris]|uniref:Conserved oligomeric Golgi complex subunit 4 n=1 Tax=Thelephora terrestris TaxID=56493 RepID=A0A9P6HQ41_9AGAM|nr:COG4-domain-containing protein [Thelephora terrestris]